MCVCVPAQKCTDEWQVLDANDKDQKVSESSFDNTIYVKNTPAKDSPRLCMCVCERESALVSCLLETVSPSGPLDLLKMHTFRFSLFGKVSLCACMYAGICVRAYALVYACLLS